LKSFISRNLEAVSLNIFLSVPLDRDRESNFACRDLLCLHREAKTRHNQNRRKEQQSQFPQLCEICFGGM
jgi:hypothetical protein